MFQQRNHFECDGNDEVKKIKFNELLFTNDYIRHILSFLDKYIIFRTCSLISKQFREQTINTPVTLHIKKKEHLERITNLTNPLHITELIMGLHVMFNVLEWVFNQPPKYLKKLSIGSTYGISSGKTIGDEHVERLCGIPAFSTLTSLHIGYNIMTDKGCSFISNCEYFKNLTELSVRQSKCNEEGVELIVRSKYMNKLTSLCFSRNNFSTIEGILSSPLFLHVKKLDLSNCSIEKLIFPQMMPLLDDLKLIGNNFKSNELVALTQTRNLTRLNLSHSYLDDDGCKIMSENQYLSKLTDLDMCYVEITTKGLKYIVSSPYFKQLVRLNLQNTSVDDEGCKILAESENMRNLTSLKLGNDEDNITLDGLSNIFNSNNLCNLQILLLKGLDLNDVNFGTMLSMSSFRKNLTSFTLSYCDLDLFGLQNVAQLDRLKELKIVHYKTMENVCECIASSSHMSNLTSLTLSCEITDNGCLHLANSIYLSQLTILELYSNQIGNDGCEYFAHCPNFPNLTTFDLLDNKMDSIGLKMIQNSPYFQNLKHFNV